MTDWLLTQHLHLYCERGGGTGLFDEPLNALSNLSFLVAGLLVLRQAGQLSDRPQRRTGQWFGVLTLLVFVGSTTFHTFANRLGWILDVGFIAVYVHAFLPTYVVRVLRRGVVEAIGWLALFIACEVAVARLIGGPTVSYAVTWIGLAILGLVTLARRLPAATAMLLAAICFGLSLTARTLDLPLCGTVPGGTHWIWHLLNGVVLYLASTSLMQIASESAGLAPRSMLPGAIDD
jgi:hypothetical protein